MAKVMPVSGTEREFVISRSGAIVIPAVAGTKPTGRAEAMQSYSGGMQLHCGGGYKAQYVLEAPQAGTHMLAARVATLQEGQEFLITANDSSKPIEIAAPCTIGLWQQTQPIEIALARGPNVLHFAVQDGSRGVTIKDFTLTAVK